MAEQTYKSPNYYDREIDLSSPSPTGPVGTPATVVGTSNKGPAFVPITVGNVDEFYQVFGSLDNKKFGPYAANEFLKNRSSLTYVKVLGAGSAATDEDVLQTQVSGRVKNAGFKLQGVSAPNDVQGRHSQAVQFLVATHTVTANEALGMPIFTDNDSYTGSTANLVRAAIFSTNTSRVMIFDGNENLAGKFTATGPDDTATTDANGKFKIVISSSLGSTYSNSDGIPGIRVLTASFDPTATDYVGKILNTDPEKFYDEQHCLYLDFPVDNELASTTSAAVSILSGTMATSSNSGETTTTMREAFGAYDTRFRAPATSMIISQPFGNTEYDLFSFESLDDGAYANNLYKISITNLKASTDDANPYGTFSVQIRDINDTDVNPIVLEQFNNCSIDPTSANYIAKLIGDRKVWFNFDTTLQDERRVISNGRYLNVSKLVRVVVTDAVERKIVPERALPFGFKGINVLKTNDNLDNTNPATVRISGISASLGHTAAIVPPLPFRYKVTKGDTSGAAFAGAPGIAELASTQFYWGVKFERNTDPLDANLSSEKNAIIEAYSKFQGIQKLDVLVTGSGADTFNNNKFTLAKVAFSNTQLPLTGTINDHMREAAYIRNGDYDKSDYTITDVLGKRVTLATLLTQGAAYDFNKFSPYAKFTTIMFGGYDGVNILNKNDARLNDRSTSFDAGGSAETTFITPGFTTAQAGVETENSAVNSYITAIDISTDQMMTNANLFSMPGIRETYITDYALGKVRDYGLAYYVMDIPSYDDDGTRLFDDSTGRPSVDKTSEALDARVIDNNYAGTYFPNVFIDDQVNRRRVKVPSSVAALAAISFNDRVAYPWFAPAGFNRASLDMVKNVEIRLSSDARDRLYDGSRINPIATFPKLGYVIYGQKTLQIATTALSSVNVRRLLLEVKRIAIENARTLVFEQNDVETRNRFTSDMNLKLGMIKTQYGIEKFKVICNETNNTQSDIDLNRMNGKIIITPTKSIEIIAIDFIVTSSGVQFV